MVKSCFLSDLHTDKTALTKKMLKFKPGFDGMSMAGASSWIFINGDRLCKDILNGDYKPMPAVGFRTAKIQGGFRRLARLTAIDTVVQSVLNDSLIQKAELIFSDNSYAYRLGRGVHTALERYVDFSNKYRIVAKLDFNSCFDNINYEILEKHLKIFCDDNKLVELIMTLVKTPLYTDGELIESQKGLLQGMPLAPLLCNIYFHCADEYLKNKRIPFIRYADDLVLFGMDIPSVTSIFDDAVSFFEKELNLTCNTRKSKIDSSVNVKFLGHVFRRDKKGIIAYEQGNDLQHAYQTWHSSGPVNNRGRVDVISDGVMRQKDFSLLFDTDTEDVSIPVENTNMINIHSDVIFDTGFLEKALKNGISVNIFNKYGESIGCFYPNASLKAPKITHQQLLCYYDDKKRMKIAREFVLASIHNTLLNIRYYNKQYPDEKYEKNINALAEVKVKIKKEKNYENLLMLEAKCRALYYECFDLFIKRDGFVFESRTRRPPRNEVNALISFGNTVLYGLISHEIQKTALDIRVGFLHATNKRYASLNLDIAEIFKPLIVDRVVFSLINKRMIDIKHFLRSENGGVYINEEGKHIFLSAFYEKMDTVITEKNKKMTYNTIVIEEIRKLIRSFREQSNYRAFRQVR